VNGIITCVCAKNYDLINNTCVCSGYMFNGYCLDFCPAHSVATVDANGIRSCVCKTNFRVDKSCCVCNGYYLGNTCVGKECGANALKRLDSRGRYVCSCI